MAQMYGLDYMETKMKNLERLVNILAASIESQYLSLNDLHKLMENIIIKTTNKDIIFSDLYMAQSEKNALAIIENTITDRLWMFQEDYEDMLIGFMYLAYLEKKINLKKLFLMIHDEEPNIIDFERLLENNIRLDNIKETDFNQDVWNHIKKLSFLSKKEFLSIEV